MENLPSFPSLTPDERIWRLDWFGECAYFRETEAGIEILGKSNKANQESVIKEVLRTFGN